VLNQFTEQFSILELAELVKRAGDALGYAVELDRYVNPRVEAEHHYYNAVNAKLLGLGLKPHYLGEELVQSMLKVIARHTHRVITHAIEPSVRWRPDEADSLAGETRLNADPLRARFSQRSRAGVPASNA
jgi:UDP-sulfoquinovose synthase